MSQTVFPTEHTLPENFKRWDIPVKMGILIGLAGVLLSALNYMFIMPASYVAFLVCTGVTFIVTLLLYGVTGVRQRKAMGGYISIKEAFAAIFMAILVSSVITTIWGLVYAKVIDPNLSEKVKESTLAFMEGMKVPSEQLDKTAADIDEQLANSTKPKYLAYNFAKSLIVSSIFGFIVALIVKRAPKQQAV